MERYSYFDANTLKTSNSLDALFPGWSGTREVLCVYSPHDDDAIIGAGYAIKAAIDDGAQVHIFIICSGNAGYSRASERDTIIETRKRETINCYKSFGVPEENVLFFGFSDFSALGYIGWQVGRDKDGHFRKAITELRTMKATRILVPNHYREHIDHVAASYMAAYDAPQAGDAFCVDWAAPHTVQSVAEYAVWADLDPEDALVSGRSTQIRANTVMMVDEAVEREVYEAIGEYASQAEIIANLMTSRKERMLEDGRFIEVYLRFNPRPKFNFAPYKQIIRDAIQ